MVLFSRDLETRLLLPSYRTTKYSILYRQIYYFFSPNFSVGKFTRLKSLIEDIFIVSEKKIRKVGKFRKQKSCLCRLHYYLLPYLSVAIFLEKSQIYQPILRCYLLALGRSYLPTLLASVVISRQRPYNSRVFIGRRKQ